MKTKHLLTFFIATTSIISACDKVELPLPKPDVIVPTDSITFPTVDSNNLNRQFKKTYVEEFTGHKCITCPANTALLIDQYNQNKDRMIVVSVHAGSFAAVEPPKYPTDFNTPYGTELFEHYDMGGHPIPSSIVNRRAFPNFNNLTIFNGTTTFWDKPIDYENTNTSTDIALGIAADYIDSTGLIYLRVSAEALNTLNGSYRLLVLCTEDSVVAEQLDGRVSESEYPNKIVPDYVHRHVLRAKLSANLSINGDPFIDGILEAGDWLDYQLAKTMPAAVVNKENTYVIALIIDDSSNEIVQSEEAHVHIK